MGRRNCLLMGNALVIVGAIFQASSWSVAQIIAARVLCGLGIGLISSTTPTFLVGLPLLLQMCHDHGRDKGHPAAATSKKQLRRDSAKVLVT